MAKAASSTSIKWVDAEAAAHRRGVGSLEEARGVIKNRHFSMDLIYAADTYYNLLLQRDLRKNPSFLSNVVLFVLAKL